MTSAIDRLAAAGEKATEGPWTPSEAVPGAIEVMHPRWQRVMNLLKVDPEGYAILDENDVTFIALARNTWPAIIEVLRAAEILSHRTHPTNWMDYSEQDVQEAGQVVNRALAALERAVAEVKP